MAPLVLFLCALAGAVLVQAFIRMLAAPSGRRVAPTRCAAPASRVPPGPDIGDWENEGGSIAVGPRRDSDGAAR
jgi:hypothetical protein